MGHKPVAEFANQRIGCDAIATTTFQTYTEFRDGHLLTLVLTGQVVKVTQDSHTSLHLVAFHTLGHQQLDATLVIVAQHRHEVLRLVVLTTQTQHQYTTSIGVQTDVAKHLTGVLMIARKL